MKLCKTTFGAVLENDGRFYHLIGEDWDALINHDDLAGYLQRAADDLVEAIDAAEVTRLAPIENQEVWAAGVTYYRSRTARMEEAKTAGGGDFYDRVYAAERPELFFKATPHRVAGPNATIRLRRDSLWNVPEPELTLVVNRRGVIVGYTIGNDMSSRDIEGENPLYLPQAKVYDGCCALGPCLLITNELLPAATAIEMRIARDEQIVFSGQTTLAAMVRDLGSLVEYLYRESSFPHGCFLLTGTGVVPPDDFTLRAGDVVHITIEPIGTLTNRVE